MTWDGGGRQGTDVTADEGSDFKPAWLGRFSNIIIDIDETRILAYFYQI